MYWESRTAVAIQQETQLLIRETNKNYILNLRSNSYNLKYWTFQTFKIYLQSS